MAEKNEGGAKIIRLPFGERRGEPAAKMAGMAEVLSFKTHVDRNTVNQFFDQRVEARNLLTKLFGKGDVEYAFDGIRGLFDILGALITDRKDMFANMEDKNYEWVCAVIKQSLSDLARILKEMKEHPNNEKHSRRFDKDFEDLMTNMMEIDNTVQKHLLMRIDTAAT